MNKLTENYFIRLDLALVAPEEVLEEAFASVVLVTRSKFSK
jgi:hypothetical protein